MREYDVSEYDKTIRAGFKCTGCKAYVVRNVEIHVKRTSWWACGKPQTRVEKSVKTDGIEYSNSYGIRIRCSCGSMVGSKVFEGVMSDHECDVRCTSSKGHRCECSCGGANHGKAFEG